MKTNKTQVLKSILGLSMLIMGISLAIQPAQAQIHEHERIPISAQTQALDDESVRLSEDAAKALHAGRYAEAENEARQSKTLTIFPGVPQAILAAALEAQGKDQEALEAYREIVVAEKSNQPRDLLPYAQLLLKSGQWAKAVAVQNQALPSLPDVGTSQALPIVHDGDMMAANSHFSTEAPEPAALATALHIARGMIYNITPDWAGEPQNTEAMAEYGKALQLAPNNALGNYFYGAGWQKLSPTERAKFGTAQQAKAHLEKAVKIGNASVKAAARKALKAAG